jgi:GDPmannose 4,6-dehydratase
MRRALITGITGQDGSYLAELLLEKGYEVHGLVRRSSTFNRERIDHLRRRQEFRGRYFLHYGDLSDADSLHQVIRESNPDEVYNLAAQSHVGISFNQPTYTGEVVALGTMRLLEAVRQGASHARFYQASSSELFGKAVEVPQSERTPFHPRSPYAVAKVYAYWATINYREAYGIFAVNGILFNHESPRRGENFVTRKITRAVAELAGGRRREPLALGNLEARRDWGFAGDYVEAMRLMLARETPDDYVIGTGETHSVREFCTAAFAHAGLSLTWQGQGPDERGVDASSGRTVVVVDRSYFRPAEVELLCADPTKARDVLGWRPRVDFEALVHMMVQADREAVEQSLAFRDA